MGWEVAEDLRPMTSGSRPAVVVASNRPVTLLEECLRVLLPQARREEAHVVVCRPASPEMAALRERWPGVRFVEAPPHTDIPRLRGLGLAAVPGMVAALTEDHCLPGPEWLNQLLRAVAEGADVAGGGMGNARIRRMVDRGAFFAEYGFFAAGREDRSGAATPALTGANVAYGPQVLHQAAIWMKQGEWEDVVHGRLAAGGRTFRFVPSALVKQNASYRVRAFMVDRFRHGRDYARVRVREEGSRLRLLRVATAPLLPLILLYRVARRAPDQRRDFLTALPATTAFLSAWAMGEAVGYMLGAAEHPEERTE